MFRYNIFPTAVFATVMLLVSMTSQVDAQFAEILKQPHKAETVNRQLCVQGLDTVGCEEDGSDAARNRRHQVKKIDGQRWMTWTEEYSTNGEKDWATLALTDTEAKLPGGKPQRVNGVSSGEGTEKYWKFDGEVEEKGKKYKRWIARFDDLLADNEELEDQRALVESGLVPDRWDYLETMDGEPHCFRHYSTFNDNTLYKESIYNYIKKLTKKEQKMKQKKVVKKMAKEAKGRRMLGQEVDEDMMIKETVISLNQDIKKRAAAKGMDEKESGLALLNSRSRAAVVAESDRSIVNKHSSMLRARRAAGVFLQFGVEFPANCIRNGRSPVCIAVSASVDTVSQLKSLTLQASFREDANPKTNTTVSKSAELFGIIVLGENNEIVFVEGFARGCAARGLKLGKLAKLQLSVCMEGQVTMDIDSILGRLGVEAKAVLEVRRFKPSLTIGGEIEVLAVRQEVDNKFKFAGFRGKAFAKVKVAIVSAGIEASVVTSPEDEKNVDNWSTGIFVTPSISVNLFFTRPSFSATIKVAQIGPKRTESDVNPGIDTPPEIADALTCAATRVEELTEANFVSFNLPETPVGGSIEYTGGRFADKKNGKCHRIKWTDLTFVCQPDGQWRRDGKIKTDNKCKSSFDKDQDNFEFGTL